MDTVLELIAKLLGKGYATATEKAELAKKVKELDEEDQEAIEEDVEEVEDLPEEEPEEDVDPEVEKGIKSLLTKQGSRIAKKVSRDVKSEVKEWLKDQSELIEKRAGVYNDKVVDKRKELSDKVRAYAQALLTDSDAAVKEMTTDATGSPYAGYTVDTELSAEIRNLITEYGVARREMETIQLTKGSYKANDLATDVTVSWITTEGGAIASTQLVLGQEELTLKKLAAIVTMTNELLEDTEIDFMSFVASRVAEGFAQAEDEAFFKGDGTSTYGGFTGLLAATDVNEVTMTGTTFASISAENLIDMQDATPQGAQANAKYFMNRTILSYVRKLRADAVTANDGKGEFLYQPPSAQGPATIWGKPVVLVEAMPAKTDTAADTSFVLYGDLRKACILGYKGEIKADRFNAGVVRNVAKNGDINLITTDREAMRWTQRVGYIRIIPTAVTKLTTAAASA